MVESSHYWTATSKDCYTIKGDCSLCEIPLLHLSMFTPPPDGRYCWVWDRIQDLTKKQGAPPEGRGESRLTPYNLLILNALKILGDSTVIQIAERVGRSRLFVYGQLKTLRIKKLAKDYPGRIAGRKDRLWTVSEAQSE